MNLDQAKEVPLELFLSSLGHEPVRRQNAQSWYLSPLRQETTPSFKVNTALNLWFDFGSGEGGSIIDFAMRYGKRNSIPAALSLIRETMRGAPPPAPRFSQAAVPPAAPAMELRRQGALRNRQLKSYLAARGIDVRSCAQAIREIHYAAHGRPRVAIGFANDAGGFELRSPTFKGTLGRKSLSIRPGETSTALVFEGFSDYLTYLTLWGRPASQVIVLNSVAMRSRAVSYLREAGASRIELFRDNDAAGESLLAYFQEHLPSADIVDRAPLYAEHADLNAGRVARHPCRQSSPRNVADLTSLPA